MSLSMLPPLLLLVSLVTAEVYTVYTYNTLDCEGAISEEYYRQYSDECVEDEYYSYTLQVNTTGYEINEYKSANCTGLYSSDFVSNGTCYRNDGNGASTLYMSSPEYPADIYGAVKAVTYQDYNCTVNTNVSVTYYHIGLCGIGRGGVYSYYTCTDDANMYQIVCADHLCETSCTKYVVEPGCYAGIYHTCIAANSTV